MMGRRAGSDENPPDWAGELVDTVIGERRLGRLRRDPTSEGVWTRVVTRGQVVTVKTDLIGAKAGVHQRAARKPRTLLFTPKSLRHQSNRLGWTDLDAFSDSLVFTATWTTRIAPSVPVWIERETEFWHHVRRYYGVEHYAKVVEIAPRLGRYGLKQRAEFMASHGFDPLGCPHVHGAGAIDKRRGAAAFRQIMAFRVKLFGEFGMQESAQRLEWADSRAATIGYIAAHGGQRGDKHTQRANENVPALWQEHAADGKGLPVHFRTSYKWPTLDARVIASVNGSGGLDAIERFKVSCAIWQAIEARDKYSGQRRWDLAVRVYERLLARESWKGLRFLSNDPGHVAELWALAQAGIIQGRRADGGDVLADEIEARRDAVDVLKLGAVSR